MTDTKTYGELLRDPRWQKRRLKALDAAKWKCSYCGDADSTLNVHHRKYLSGHAPWDYDDAYLQVLCEDCHAFEHASNQLIDLVIRRNMKLRAVCVGMLSLLARVLDMLEMESAELILKELAAVLTATLKQRSGSATKQRDGL